METIHGIYVPGLGDDKPRGQDEAWSVFATKSKTLASFSPQQLGKILSIRPLYDGRVPLADTKIDGAHEQTIWTFGHFLSIAYAVSLGKRHAIQFIKQS